MNILELITNPILRGPTLGSMLICLSISLIGVVIFIRRSSLIGEVLSHASYPGVMIALLVLGAANVHLLPFTVFIGAALAILLAVKCIQFLQQKARLVPDCALTVTLVIFFGVGVTFASYIQNKYASSFRSVQTFLYGQSATMHDQHLIFYSLFTILLLLFITLFFKQITILSFDHQYARTNGSLLQWVEKILLVFIAFSMIIGMRSVGVILLGAMLIAPATAARQFTNKLSLIFFLSGIFGAFSGFMGTFISLAFSFSLPTGPMIILTSGLIALGALFFAPTRGLCIRLYRISRFQKRCVEENIIKTLWHLSQGGKDSVSLESIKEKHFFSTFHLKLLLFKIKRQKWIDYQHGWCTLTAEGIKKGRRLVRLHRLWEAYLVNTLGLGIERVHASAEEMEHILILSPEFEKKLIKLLEDPKSDPHAQPIPSRDEVMIYD